MYHRLLLLLILICLNSCSSSWHKPWKSLLSNNVSADPILSSSLYYGGAKSIVIGDTVKIVIPSIVLFGDIKSEYNYQASSLLFDLVSYLNQFDLVMVKIAAYTNDLGSELSNKLVSTVQSRKVAHSLKMRGLRARFVVADGYGGTHLLVPSSVRWSNISNCRIEITGIKSVS